MSQVLATHKSSAPLLLTENGYLLCYRHATEWIQGGSAVVMRPPSVEEVAEFGDGCADCAEEEG